MGRRRGTREPRASGPHHPARSASELEGLTVTHWFEARPDGGAYDATVRFRGQRVGIEGKPGQGDSFVRDELIQGIVPASGPISVTTHVYGLTPGDWTVTAELLPPADAARRARRKAAPRPTGAHTLPRASWSWRRWAISPASFGPVRTRWGPLARLVAQPAVVPGSWSTLVALGVAIGLVLHTALLARAGVPAGPPLVVALGALLAGLAGAKLRYIALHPATWRNAPAEGWAVDGFLIVMPITAVGGLLAFEIPIGLFLDTAAPALFFGVAIGRVGCFLTGCCAGRCTAARWGIWSSDRRIGARRIPTQLFESATGLALAIATLVLVLSVRPPVEGAIFFGSLAIYWVIRRGLLRLRAERSAPRRSTPMAPGASRAADGPAASDYASRAGRP